MYKKTLLVSLLISASALAKAQFVSFNANEITRLKQLASEDASAGKRLNDWKQQAEQALADTPNPIDTIHTEGRLKGSPQKVATAKALEDIRKIYALSLTYRLTAEKRYLDKAAAFLTAWAKANQPNGDPIDDTNLDGAIEGYDLIKKDLKAKENKKISRWLQQTGETEINKLNPKRATSFNNWHSHRLKIVGEIGFAIDDKDLQRWAIEGLKVQLVKNLKPDGSSWDFEERDAMHYHLYDLEPLLKLAIVLKRATGVDYYSYQSEAQTSIKKSVEWVLPYATGEKTHGEFVNSKVKFDRDRAKNGEAEYKPGTLFQPKAAVHMLSLASFFQPDFAATVRKIEGTDEAYPNWQLLVNAAEKH